MSADVNFLAFALSSVVVLATPGPSNILLASAGLAQGMRRSLPLLTYELAGYLLAITAWGLFLASAQLHYSWLGIALRVGASIYLACIAVKMWRATCALEPTAVAPINARALCIATLLNPKALLFASVIFPVHAFDNLQLYLTTSALFAGLLLPIGMLWIRFGAALGGARWISPVSLQRVAAVLMGVFSASVAWAAWH